MSKILQVKNLSVNTQKLSILKAVSFDIKANESVALIGKSGSGKTMTVSAVMNLLPAGVKKTGGEILVSGKPFENSMRGRYIGAVLQNPASYFDSVFTIKSHFEETLKAHNIPVNIQRIKEQIVAVGLQSEEVLNAYPFQLSGGMLQRLMIGMALMLEAPLIIADEPTTDLDLTGQKDILSLISALRAERKFSLLLITHDLGVAAKIAEKAVIIDNGEVQGEYTVEDLMKGDVCEAGKVLLSAYNSLHNSPWGNL